MIEWLQQVLSNTTGLGTYPAFIISYAVIIFSMLGCSWLANDLTKRYIRFFTHRVLAKAHSRWIKSALQRKLFYRLSHLAPALVIYAAIPLLELHKVAFTVHLIKAVETATVVYMIAVVTFVIHSLLKVIEDLYQGLENARKRPIKSYIQVVSMFIYVIAGVLVVSAILDKSPLVFFTGLGAMVAVLMVVFKDSIMGLVASVQNAGSDIMHIGDWVEIPQYGVDGDVIEMSLNTIKVQNFDKTIITIPAQTILAGGIKNWRGMEEAGGRRVTRAVCIDMRTIKFCTPEMTEKFKKLGDLSEYLSQKESTNIGAFRTYLEMYLKNHPDVKQQLTCFVRHLQPTDKGLPVELYFFTKATELIAHEKVQADIFDHVLAIIPEFDLKVYHSTTGQ